LLLARWILDRRRRIVRWWWLVDLRLGKVAVHGSSIGFLSAGKNDVVGRISTFGCAASRLGYDDASRVEARAAPDPVRRQRAGDLRRRTHEAHHLSQTAARVWHLADGERDLPDLASALRESVASATDGDAVTLDDATSLELARLALSELDRAGLLARALPDLAVLGEPMSRRQMLGVTAALLPVVASIVAPTPAMAATCQATATANPITLTGTNFVVGATTVAVGGGGVT
jgi:hypothetical protein